MSLDANGVLQPSLSFISQAARPFGVVSGLYIDSAGNKYVADATNKVVQVYNVSNARYVAWYPAVVQRRMYRKTSRSTVRPNLYQRLR